MKTKNKVIKQKSIEISNYIYKIFLSFNRITKKEIKIKLKKFK